jgi:hypothetical protein
VQPGEGATATGPGLLPPFSLLGRARRFSTFSFFRMAAGGGVATEKLASTCFNSCSPIVMHACVCACMHASKSNARCATHAVLLVSGAADHFRILSFFLSLLFWTERKKKMLRVCVVNAFICPTQRAVRAAQRSN